MLKKKKEWINWILLLTFFLQAKINGIAVKFV